MKSRKIQFKNKNKNVKSKSRRMPHIAEPKKLKIYRGGTNQTGALEAKGQDLNGSSAKDDVKKRVEAFFRGKGTPDSDYEQFKSRITDSNLPNTYLKIDRL